MTLAAVKDKIVACCLNAGRNPQDVRLLAVSKTKPAGAILDVFRQGHKHFGENYADELIAKATELKNTVGLHWTFIGQLQSNKIQKLVLHAHEIQTLASEKHARYVDRYCREFGKQSYPVWLHVNAGGEDQKFGLPLGEVSHLSRFIHEECASLDLQGILAVPPAIYNDAAFPGGEPPPLYLDLARVARKTGRGQLSLGMTSDLSIAIAAGSNCVRVGTAIFGAR